MRTLLVQEFNTPAPTRVPTALLVGGGRQAPLRARYCGGRPGAVCC